LKFYCGDDLDCFYSLRDEIFPININYRKKSNFTDKLVRVIYQSLLI